MLCILREKIVTTQKCTISEHIQTEEKVSGVIGCSRKTIKVKVIKNLQGVEHLQMIWEEIMISPNRLQSIFHVSLTCWTLFLNMLNSRHCLVVKLQKGKMFFPLPYWQKMPFFSVSLECGFHRYCQIVIQFLCWILPTTGHKINIQEFSESWRAKSSAEANLFEKPSNHLSKMFAVSTEF